MQMRGGELGELGRVPKTFDQGKQEMFDAKVGGHVIHPLSQFGKL